MAPLAPGRWAHVPLPATRLEAVPVVAGFATGAPACSIRASAVISACAAASVTPGRRRPKHSNAREPVAAGLAGSIVSGVKASGSLAPMRKPAGATPMMVREPSWMASCRPTTPGSPPNQRCQKP